MSKSGGQRQDKGPFFKNWQHFKIHYIFTCQHAEVILIFFNDNFQKFTITLTMVHHRRLHQLKKMFTFTFQPRYHICLILRSVIAITPEKSPMAVITVTIRAKPLATFRNTWRRSTERKKICKYKPPIWAS